MFSLISVIVNGDPTNQFNREFRLNHSHASDEDCMIALADNLARVFPINTEYVLTYDSNLEVGYIEINQPNCAESKIVDSWLRNEYKELSFDNAFLYTIGLIYDALHYNKIDNDTAYRLARIFTYNYALTDLWDFENGQVFVWYDNLEFSIVPPKYDADYVLGQLIDSMIDRIASYPQNMLDAVIAHRDSQ